VPRLA